MKTLLLIATLFTSFSSLARDLYPDEILMLPSSEYQMTLLKDLKMTDKRTSVLFVNGKVVNALPKNDDVFFCELTNARGGETQITLEQGNQFVFSADDGTAWERFLHSRIWRKRAFVLDNDDVQYFSCNDTAAFTNDTMIVPLNYKMIKSAVGSFLKISIND